MQALKIVLMCVVGAMGYGIIHDQFTAHICVEYFSVFHPPVFGTESPTLLALGWGVIATWWVGAFLGMLLACAARLGPRKRLEAHELMMPIAKLLLIMGISAITSGAIGYTLTKSDVIGPPVWVGSILPSRKYAAFMADLWAHNASYLTGFIGGIVLCVMSVRRRNVSAAAGGSEGNHN